MSTTSKSLFRVETIDRKGAKPNVERVFALDAKHAAKLAIEAHQAKIAKAKKLPRSVHPSTICITPVSVKPVSLTTPKPKLTF